MAAHATIRVLRPGNTVKRNPFTIAIVANPVLEAPWQSAQFIRDPIISNETGFHLYAQSIVNILFGSSPGQAELLLQDPSVAPLIRVVSLFPQNLPVISTNALVAQDSRSSLLIPLRANFGAFLAGYDLEADIAYAVTMSTSHNRAAAYHTTDDDGKGGVPFTLDGISFYHRYHPKVPGTIAIHISETSITPLHEFGHAISSYSNGMIVDLYVGNERGVNSKIGRPIPATFGSYDNNLFQTDHSRDSLGYPPSWQSYHCELTPSPQGVNVPTIMDNYFQVGGGASSSDCQFDKITRAFILDRVRAKVNR